MIKYVVLATVVLVFLSVAGWYFFLRQDTQPASDQIKSPHFLDSTPMHSETYAAQPINVTINFDFDLSDKSTISVTSADNEEWSEGEIAIENNQIALKKSLRQGLPDGLYSVKYSACWPDGSCHPGQFSFSIDTRLQNDYTDLRGRPEVTVDMKDITYVQERIIISSGTKVTWVNLDEAEHFINTETHPAHTYFPVQNSFGLDKGAQYSTTFHRPGQYNYHCSAHAAQMTASVIVAN